jgi:hypothetical protein
MHHSIGLIFCHIACDRSPPAADSAADEGVAEDQGDQEPQPGDAPDLAYVHRCSGHPHTGWTRSSFSYAFIQPIGRAATSLVFMANSLDCSS